MSFCGEYWGKITRKGGGLGNQSTPAGSRWSPGRRPGDKVKKLETFLK